jgi:hypothetical protein
MPLLLLLLPDLQAPHPPDIPSAISDARRNSVGVISLVVALLSGCSPNGFPVVSNDFRGARGKLGQHLKGSVKGYFIIAEKCRHTDSGAELVFQ